jgi:hypothetical protein
MRKKPLILKTQIVEYEPRLGDRGDSIFFIRGRDNSVNVYG